MPQLARYFPPPSSPPSIPDPRRCLLLFGLPKLVTKSHKQIHFHFRTFRPPFTGWLSTSTRATFQMDRNDLQRTVESLRHQLRIQRVPISRSAVELKAYIEQHQPNDPLVNPVDKARNPWAEKSKCEIL